MSCVLTCHETTYHSPGMKVVVQWEQMDPHVLALNDILGRMADVLGKMADILGRMADILGRMVDIQMVMLVAGVCLLQYLLQQKKVIDFIWMTIERRNV